MAKDVVVLDLALADRLLLGYKRGLLSRSATRAKLVADCGVGEFADKALAEADRTALHELEWRVGNPDEPGREEVRVVVVRCDACEGAGCGCARCGGRGFTMREAG